MSSMECEIEFDCQISPSGVLQIPEGLRRQIRTGQIVRVKVSAPIAPDLAVPTLDSRPSLQGFDEELPNIGVAEAIQANLDERMPSRERDLEEQSQEEFSPPLSESEDELRQLARTLLGSKGVYWKSFLFSRRGEIGIEALMGWIRFGCKCVYCGRNLAETTAMLGLGTTDHLLPRANYPELNFLDRQLAAHDYLNSVPACFSCNRVKGSFDPNTCDELIYSKHRKAKITPAEQIVLIDRARRYVAEQRQKLLRSYREDQAAWDALAKAVKPATT